MSLFDYLSPSSSSNSLFAIGEALRIGKATTRNNADRIHEKSQRTFVGSEVQDLNQDESVNFHVRNPSGNSRAFHFYFGEFTHGDDCRAVLHTDVENVVDDTTKSASNNWIGSDVSSQAEVSIASSFDSLGVHFEQVYLGSDTESIFDGYRVTLPPGEELLLELQNQGGSQQVGARFAWSESDLSRYN